MQKDSPSPEKDKKVPEIISAPETEQEQAAINLPSQCDVDAIIRKRVNASLAVGLVPVPLFDAAALSAVQIEMLCQLCKLYKIPFKTEVIKKIIVCVVGGAVPVLLTPSLRSLSRYIPVVGFGVGVVSTSFAGAASTYAIGHVFAKHFASGGDLLNFNAKEMGEDIKAKYESGKEVVKGWVKKPAAAEPAATPAAG